MDMTANIAFVFGGTVIPLPIERLNKSSGPLADSRKKRLIICWQNKMVGDNCCCTRREFKERVEKRDREQANIIRKLTDCLQETNLEIDKLQDSLRKKDELLLKERDMVQVLMIRCDNLLSSHLPRLLRMARFAEEGQTVELLNCKVCKDKHDLTHN